MSSVRRKSWPSVPKKSILKNAPPDKGKSAPPESKISAEGGEISPVKINNNNHEVIQVVQEEVSANSARTARKRRIAGIFQHYYPEGGWGYAVLICAFFSQFLGQGLQWGMLALMPFISRKFQASQTETDWLTPLSMAVSCLVSPLIVGICRRKSTRLTAVLGGLVIALGCLFTSFASQFHQLYLSYGLTIGIGVALTKDPATLMVGQYFKRKRNAMEIILVASNGLGLSAMSAFILISISSIGWRLGLASVAGVVSILFVLGTFYRSASLYHPQRRAILHLKSQKRKIKSKDKEKNKAHDDTPPLFDITTLKSRTVQIMLASTTVAALGLNTPLLFMAQQAHQDGIRGKSFLWLQAYLGLGWALGCIFFGCLCVHTSHECRISKQYLCQAALFLCGITIMAFTAVEGYKGYVVFVWAYGIFLGGYQYTLKMYIYEKVRARNFARAWGFAQSSMSIPTLISIPLLNSLKPEPGSRGSYALSATFVILASLVMAMIDAHKKSMKKRRKNCRQMRMQQQQMMDHRSSTFAPDDPTNSSSISQLQDCPPHPSKISDLVRQYSFSDQDDILPPVSLLSHQRSFIYDDCVDINPDELSIYSEEGIDDMDMPNDILFNDLDFLDNITSCNKVENCLMLSEYEQNLIKETEGPMGLTGGNRRARKWSLFRQPTLQTIHSVSEDTVSDEKALFNGSGGRSITAVIEEHSCSSNA